VSGAGAAELRAIAWWGGGEPGGEGRWGPPPSLAMPLDDRGLLLADGLFETVLVEAGEPRLLAEHLQRWQRGAALLGMAPPPALQRVRQLAAAAVQRSGIRSGALRLNWSRGGAGRGIDLPADPSRSERFWLQLSAASPGFAPLRVLVSPSERRCATSLLSRCKTFAYGSAIQARRQARAAGADDALLLSTAGGLCCGSTANLLLRQDGRWLTPPLASGCLPGVMRQRALDLGLIAEATGPIELAAVASGAITAAWLLNSLGCHAIRSIDGQPLAAVSPAPGGRGDGQESDARAAEAFWRRLLQP